MAASGKLHNHQGIPCIDRELIRPPSRSPQPNRQEHHHSHVRKFHEELKKYSPRQEMRCFSKKKFSKWRVDRGNINTRHAHLIMVSRIAQTRQLPIAGSDEIGVVTL